MTTLDTTTDIWCIVVSTMADMMNQSLDVFKSFKAEVEFQLEKKIKAVKFGHSGEYYGRYDESGEQL